MADDIIPYDVQQFILRYIDSIAQLEGLLLFRYNPEKKWDAEAIAHELYITEPRVMVLLSRLLEQGFVTVSENETYQYQPKSPELREMTERTAELYRQYLVPVTNLIHSKAKSRVQEFADAFRIRKD